MKHKLNLKAAASLPPMPRAVSHQIAANKARLRSTGSGQFIPSDSEVAAKQ